MQHKFRTTIYACFTGYIVQAIVNNFAPLLFLTFEKTYQIPLGQITMLITINFGIQLCIDLLSAGFVDRIGYRASILIAHVFAALGLLGLAVLPELFPNAFAGLLTAVVIYAIGGGLIEVLISPIMESCPTDNKEKAMSLLHSFYCWGHVAVVLISTLFFKVFGIEHWKVLTCLWVIVPVVNVFAFLKAPMAPLVEKGESGLSLRDLCRQKVFWLLMLMMLCAGASEQSVSQWASTFAEQGLGVSKMVGDLAGPMAFAVLMGSARAFYGKFGDKMDLDRFMTGRQYPLCDRLSLYLTGTWHSCVTAWMRVMRAVGWHHVAWHIQQGVCRLKERRHSDVCNAGTGGRSGMLGRSDAGRRCFECGIR